MTYRTENTKEQKKIRKVGKHTETKEHWQKKTRQKIKRSGEKLIEKTRIRVDDLIKTNSFKSQTLKIKQTMNSKSQDTF